MPKLETSKSTEHYLMAMCRINEVNKGKSIHTTELADHLEISLASVSDMVQKLAKRGLVTYKKYQGMRLTVEGKREALLMIRKHRLVECFLEEFLEIDLDQLHEEAHEFEHAVSERVEAKLDKVLHHPKTCPHGNPIPSRNGQLPLDHSTPLLTLKERAGATIAKFTKEESHYIKYLHSLGLYPGTNLKVLSIEPYGGPIYLKVGPKTCAIGKEAAEHIWVKGVKYDA